MTQEYHEIDIQLRELQRGLLSHIHPDSLLSARLEVEAQYTKDTLARIEKNMATKLELDLVKTELKPIKLLVFSMSAMILAAVLAAMIGRVVS